MKIISLGNSFSDDATYYAHRILASMGYGDTEMGNLYIGGCDLKTHLQNLIEERPLYEYRTPASGEELWRTAMETNAREAFFSRAWDVVTLQQQSADSGKPETYQPYLNGILREATDLCPQAKIYWLMTWAYQSDSDLPRFAEFDRNQQKMYEAITDAVQKIILPHPAISGIVPLGTAIQNARTSSWGDTLTRDGFHLSMDKGRYVAALAYIACLTGYDITKATFLPEGLTENDRAIALAAVQAAIATPFAVTKL